VRSDRAVPLHAAKSGRGFFAKDICLVAQLRVIRNMLVMAARRNARNAGTEPQHAPARLPTRVQDSLGRISSFRAAARNTHKFTGKEPEARTPSGLRGAPVRHRHTRAFSILNFHLESLSVAGGANGLAGCVRSDRTGSGEEDYTAPQSRFCTYCRSSCESCAAVILRRYGASW